MIGAPGTARGRRHLFSRTTLEEPVMLPGRLSWLRLLAVPLVAGVPHFVLGVHLDAVWGLLSATSALLFLLAGRLPVTAAVGQIALLLVVVLHDVNTLPFQVMASVALFEAALTRPVRWAVIPGVLLAAATVWLTVLNDAGHGGLTYRVVFVALAPLLLGAYLYSQHRAARARHEAAVATQSRARQADREATFQERAAIARELHDVVAHHVASIALRSSIARDVLPMLDPAARKVLDEVHATAALTLTEMRRLVALLRLPAGEAPGTPTAVEMLDPTTLSTDVHQLVERVRGLGLAVELSTGGILDGLDAGQALTVLRTVQEGLTNVVRHAGLAASAVVAVSCAGGVVTVSVTNHGGSRSVTMDRSPRGFGLLGLRERVELLDGTLEAGPFGGGWRTSMTFRTHHRDRPDQTAPAVNPPSARPAAAAAVPSPADRAPASAAGLDDIGWLTAAEPAENSRHR